VAVDKPTYASGEPIGVTIANSTDEPLFVLSRRTYCTVVAAEREVGGRWQEEGRCVEGAPPSYVQIPAGAHSSFTVEPTRAEPVLEPGSYRLRLTAAVGAPDAVTSTIYSALFTIGD